jgi:NIMA (never in mitosis gene a)-related kinase
MEYCDEKDLKTFINLYKDKDEYINENIIYNIIKQICFGIKEIHDKNIVHRDLKPQNIFMCKGQQIKIGDFGISKQLFYSQNYKSTKISAGTYGYVAPEIIQNRKYNKKSDIWSFGCIVYELFHLSEHYLDIYIGVKKIDKEIYNEKWQVLIDLLLEFNPDKRPDINQIIEFIHKNFDIIIFKSIKYEIQKELKNDIKKGIKVYQVIN